MGHVPWSFIKSRLSILAILNFIKTKYGWEGMRISTSGKCAILTLSSVIVTILTVISLKVLYLHNGVKCMYTIISLHRDVNPKVTFTNKTQHIFSFVTEIQSYIGLLKSFIVGNYPYQLLKTLKPHCAM